MRVSLLRAPRSTPSGNRLLSTTRVRLDDQSRAKGESVSAALLRIADELRI